MIYHVAHNSENCQEPVARAQGAGVAWTDESGQIPEAGHQEAELRASLMGLCGVRGRPGRVPHEAAVAPEGRSPGGHA